MGFIRTGAILILSTALFLSLFLGNIFLTLTWSLEYDSLQPQLQKSANDFAETTGIKVLITNIYPGMKTHCRGSEFFELSTSENAINIPCNIIKESPQKTINYTIQELTKQIYYQEYNCEFWDCLKTTDKTTILITEKARKYWNSNYHLALLVSLALFLLILVFVREKHSAINILGILVIVVSIPFKEINLLTKIVPDSWGTSLIIGFISKAYNVFLINIIVGGLIFITGIAFSFYLKGIKVSEFFRHFFRRKSREAQESEIKEIVDKEIKKRSFFSRIKKPKNKTIDLTEKKS